MKEVAVINYQLEVESDIGLLTESFTESVTQVSVCEKGNGRISSVFLIWVGCEIVKAGTFPLMHFLQNLPQYVPSGIVRTAQLQYIQKYGNITLKLF